ncbi:Hypothetical predicted protein, partial [Paramuricea clavata]
MTLAAKLGIFSFIYLKSFVKLRATQSLFVRRSDFGEYLDHVENVNSTNPRKIKTKKMPDGYLSYDEKGDIDILKKEGEPGWMEKLIQE